MFDILQHEVSRSFFLLVRRKSLAPVREIERMSQTDPGELAAYRLERLQKVLDFVYRHNRFYRRRWDEHGVSPNITKLEDLEKFPIVSKTDLLNARDRGELISEPFQNDSSLVRGLTTGSSGEPFEVVTDRGAYYERVASTIYCQKLYGYRFGDRMVKLWRGTLAKPAMERLKEVLFQRYTLTIYDPSQPIESAMSPARAQEIVRRMNELMPLFVDGFVSALRYVAELLLSGEARLEFQPKAVITGAEVLRETDRHIISKAFRCPVFNRYGGTETSALAHECAEQSRAGHRLHVMDTRGVLDTVEPGGNRLVSGKLGEVVWTDFSSLAQPLIRYRNGDLADRIDGERCACGSSFGLLREIGGRVNDNVKLKDGTILSNHLWHHYAKKCLGIRQYRITQRKIDDFLIELVLSPSVDSQELDHVKEYFEEALHGCRVDWQTVSDIPPGPGGKLRQVIALQ